MCSNLLSVALLPSVLTAVTRDLELDRESFGRVVAQRCVEEMFLQVRCLTSQLPSSVPSVQVRWRHSQTAELIVANAEYKFSSSFTDYGVCCKIYPQLDFENEKTKDKDVSEYESTE